MGCHEGRMGDAYRLLLRTPASVRLGGVRLAQHSVAGLKGIVQIVRGMVQIVRGIVQIVRGMATWHRLFFLRKS